MRASLLILILGFTATVANGQSNQASQIYLELFGAAGGVSLNYDARFGQKENGLGYRVGVGGEGTYSSNLGSSMALGLPVGINYLLGKQKHYLEMGTGATVFFGDKTYYPRNYWGLNANVGYRLTPFQKKGVSFRAGFMPWIFFNGSNTGIKPYLYLSVGYRF